jgi:hypothetical protein
MSLHQLLYAISQGKAINLDSLHKALPSNVSPKDIFGENELVAKNKYIVSIVDRQRFDNLLAQSKAPATRAQAASHSLQSSHYVACDSAYMLCFPLHSAVSATQSAFKLNNLANAKSSAQENKIFLPRTLLSVASVRTQALPALFTPAKHAILIENQDCFFDWQKLICHFAETVNIGECDIYFAGGKRILNPAFAPFLMQYDNLYCAFDYDLDGLKMARSLITKQYADTKVLLPDTLSNLHTLFTFKPSSTQSFLESLKICKDMSLFDLNTVISATQHFMEQEALLSYALYSDTKDF